MFNKATPDDRPPAYADALVLLASTLNPDPPPSYTPLDLQQFPPITAAQLPPPPGQTATTDPPPAAYHVATVLAQQPRQQLPPAINAEQYRSFMGHLYFACFVFWFCNPLFGLTASVLTRTLNY